MVFGLFSKERALKRTAKKATNKLAQSQERWAAMEKLRDIGTDEALGHLLDRFSVVSLKSVDDEQEKAWLVQAMIAMGERCLGPLRRYMKASNTIAYPLRILEDVANREQALEIVDELLADEEPGYTNDPTKRKQLIDWLSEWQSCSNQDAVVRITPYLQDFDEGVRFAAVDALSLRPSEEAAEPLVNALLEEKEESGRLKMRIIEVLCEHELPLGERKKEVKDLLEQIADDYRLQRDKIVQRKPAK